MMEQELIECPYDHHHKVRPDRIEAHVMKCQYNHKHIDKGFVICPFNFKHHMPKSEYEDVSLFISLTTKFPLLSFPNCITLIN